MIIYESKTVYKKIGEVPQAALDGPEVAVDYMRGAFKEFPLQEQVWVLCLDRKNKVRSREMIGLGTSTSCLVDASCVFRPAILQGAPAIIVVHNHPSGDPSPSSGDLRCCKNIGNAGKTLDILVNDFIVIGHGHKAWWSASDVGLI